MSTLTKIAFIGLGHMGRPMAENLIKAGYDLQVFDLNSDAVSELVEQGAIAADSVIDAVNGVDVVFTMLQTGEQVKSVCLGEQGFFQHAKPGTLFIDCSSIAIKDSRDVHEAAKKRDVLMVDAPVSGGVKGAQTAALTIMVGGEQATFKTAEPILETLAAKVIHAGAAGTGQAAKVCNNMVLGISMIAVSEAFNLGKALGLDPQKFFDISSISSGQCWALTSYCPEPGIVDNVPSNNNYQPGFSAAMMLKDLMLSQTAAERTQTNTPLGQRATQLYQQFVESGGSEIDFSGIIEQLK